MGARSLGYTLTALLVCSAAVADEQYLCVPEQSTGFSFNKTDGWHRTTFKVGDLKYLVRRSKPDEGYSLLGAKWVVFELGQTSAIAQCTQEFDDNGALSCGGYGLYEWRMSRNTMRFLYGYLFGYTDGADNNENTPALNIGKCAPL